MYGTYKMVKAATGVKPEDLSLNTEEELQHVIESWLLEAKDYIDRNRRRSFDEDTPPMIENIAVRIVANMIGIATQRRTSPIIQTGDFNVQLVEDEVITQSIRSDLRRLFPKNARIAVSRTRGR